MPAPAMPGTAFVVIEAEFVLGGFEAVLDSPAMAFDQHQLLHGRALGAPGGEEGQIAVGNVAADQETARPLCGEGAVVFAGIEIGQFEIAQSCRRGPLVPSPADRRRHAPSGSVCAIFAAVLRTNCFLPQELNTRLAATPRT